MQKRVALVIVIGLALFFGGSVYAQTTSPTKQAKYCSRAVSTISKILSQSNTRLANRQKYASERKTNIQTRINALKSRGADTSTLQADADKFASMLDVWNSDYQKYLSLIQSTQKLICGSSDGQFAQAIQLARNQLKQVNQDSSNFKAFYQNTLNNDFKIARASIKPKGKTK